MAVPTARSFGGRTRSGWREVATKSTTAPQPKPDCERRDETDRRATMGALDRPYSQRPHSAAAPASSPTRASGGALRSRRASSSGRPRRTRASPVSENRDRARRLEMSRRSKSLRWLGEFARISARVGAGNSSFGIEPGQIIEGRRREVDLRRAPPALLLRDAARRSRWASSTSPTDRQCEQNGDCFTGEARSSLAQTAVPRIRTAEASKAPTNLAHWPAPDGSRHSDREGGPFGLVLGEKAAAFGRDDR